MFIVIVCLVTLYLLLTRWLWRRRLSVAGKRVLVTGCDTGFGHHAAMYLDSLGAVVYAGCLHSTGDGANKLRQTCSSRLIVLQMDITSDQQVAACLALVTLSLQANKSVLWGVVNNAGLNFLGDIELVTMRQYERILAINAVGMVRVTKTFLPLLRHSKVAILSRMAKHAAEAFSDILRLEMVRFGVHVVIVEPGNFGAAIDGLNMERIKSDFKEMEANMSDEVRQAYGKDHIRKVLDAVDRARPTSCFNVQRVVDAITDGLFLVQPTYRYLIPGGQGLVDAYTITASLYSFLPTSLMDWILLNIVCK